MLLKKLKMGGDGVQLNSYDVIEVYARPHDPKFPVVCMDESSVQLIGEVQEPIPAAHDHPELMDDEVCT